jgi:hypothetical protein
MLAEEIFPSFVIPHESVGRRIATAIGTASASKLSFIGLPNA